MIRACILILGVLIALECAAHSEDRDYAKMTPDSLISDLTNIDSPTVGITPMTNYDAFIAEDLPPRFAGGILGDPPPDVPGAMREIVRRGLAVLPTLIVHLGDQRPTALIVGNRLGTPGGFFMWGYFGNEYDPRIRPANRLLPDHGNFEQKTEEFPGQYTVRVGDVCYVLIGQIVNRHLLAVRYQPSGGIVVNSPIQETSLAERVKEDWSNLTPEAHRNSLLADIEAGRYEREYIPAIARLNYYYFGAYEALAGTSLAKKLEYDRAQ